MLDWLTRRRTNERIARSLYDAIVSEARRPDLYTEGRVPDTPQGRFEMIAAFQALVLMRLGAEGEAGQSLGQALNEVFVRDMDASVREMGIGDMGVAKRVKKAAAALYDRHRDYAAALSQSAPEAFEAAISTHVWDGESPPPDGARYLAEALRKMATLLAATPGPAILSGRWPEQDAAAH